MYSYCAAALTATVMMTTSTLAIDGRPREDQIPTDAYATVQLEPGVETSWASFRDIFVTDEDEDDDGYDTRGGPYEQDRDSDYGRGPQRPAPRNYYQNGPVPNEIPIYQENRRPEYLPARPPRPREVSPTPRRDPRPAPTIWNDSKSATPSPNDRGERPAALNFRRETLIPPATLTEGVVGRQTSIAPPADGRVHIRVDISTNRMTVVNQRGERFVWPVSTARPGHVTITANNVLVRADPRDINYRSKTYHGSPMPYAIWWKRSQGYAIHGTLAESQLGKPASAGCVRLSRAHARILFDWVREANGAVVNIR